MQSISVHHTCTKLICYDDKSLGFQLTQLQLSSGGECERSLQCPKEWNACRFQGQWQWCLHNIQRMLHWNNFLHHPGTSWIFSLNKPWYCLILESDNGSNDFIPNPSGPQGCCLSCSGHPSMPVFYQTITGPPQHDPSVMLNDVTGSIIFCTDSPVFLCLSHVFRMSLLYSVKSINVPASSGSLWQRPVLLHGSEHRDH